MSDQIHLAEVESIQVDSSLKRRKRRRFTADEKLRIAREAEQCSGRGELSELMRRECISHSQLTTWRQRLRDQGPAGLESQRPGPKPSVDDRDLVIQRQQRAIAELQRELAIANALVQMQKKAREILGMARPRIEERQERISCG